MKKIISIILAALMCASSVSIFTSCSDAGSDENKAGTTSENVDVTEDEEETVFIDPFAGTDFGGRDFRVYTSVDATDATNGDRFIRGSGELNGEAVNDAVFKRNSDVSELLNVNMTFIEANYDYGTVESKIKTSIIAGIDEWDVIANDIRSLANLSKDGYIRNIYKSTILDLNQSYWYADAMRDLMFIDGGMYLLVGDYFTDALASSHALYVNESLLNDYYSDTEYINKIVFDGSWTIDVMTDIVNNCYLDLDGNGTMEEGDRFGFTCQGKWGSMIPFLIATGIQFIERTDNGIEFCFNNERSVKILEKLNQIFYASGTLSEITDYTPENLRMNFSNGLTLIMGLNRLGDLANLRDVEFGVGVVPYPKLDDEQDNYVTSMHDTSEIGAIPSTLPNESTDFCHTVLEVLCRETSKTVIPEYYENGLKVKYSNGQDDAKMIDLIHDTICTPFAVAYDSALANFMLSSTFSVPLTAGSSDFTSYYAKLSKAAGKSLEKVYNAFEKVLENGN